MPDAGGRPAGVVAALLPAAGSGARLGLGAKAFVRVGDRSLLAWAVEALRGAVDEVIVAVPAGAEARARREVPDAGVIEGAATRQGTVARLLEATSAPWLLVHDAARPFLPRAVVDRVLEATRASGAASAALPVVDTLVDAETGATVPRERLRAVQTPQGFRRDWLLAAHRAAARDGIEATDDAALVRRLGHEVRLVEGSALLRKITTPEDLRLAPALEALWLEERTRSDAAAGASS